MNALPPQVASEKKPFAFTAANAGVALLLSGIVLSLIFKSAASTDGSPMPRGLAIAFSATGILCYLAGFVFSIVALCGIPRHGRGGLLGKGLVGLLLNGAILLATSISLLLLLPKTLERAKNTQVLKQFDDAVKAAKESARDAINSTNGLRPDPARLDNFIATAQQAAKNLKGAEAETMQASLAFFAKLKVENDAFTKAADALDTADILNGLTLTKPEQIPARRKAVQEFITANAHLRDFSREVEQHFEAALKTRNLSPGEIERALASFRKGQNHSLLLKIRDCDERIGKGLLATLALLEEQWGKWKFDKKDEDFVFQDATAGKHYSNLQADVASAGEEQAALQKQMLGAKK